MIAQVCLSGSTLTKVASRGFQIRNLSRLIWINVAVPPSGDITKGKSFAANLTAAQLRRKKVEALKLCICFAISVKHYLRGEDGVEWEDLAGVLPASIVRIVQKGENEISSGKTSAYMSYAATARSSRDSSIPRTGSPAEMLDESYVSTLVPAPPAVPESVASKRVRVKRSKDKLKQPSMKTSSKTPLLNTLHQTIDFNADPSQLTTPLPLMCVVQPIMPHSCPV